MFLKRNKNELLFELISKKLHIRGELFFDLCWSGASGFRNWRTDSDCGKKVSSTWILLTAGLDNEYHHQRRHHHHHQYHSDRHHQMKVLAASCSRVKTRVWSLREGPGWMTDRLRQSSSLQWCWWSSWWCWLWSWWWRWCHLCELWMWTNSRSTRCVYLLIWLNWNNNHPFRPVWGHP